LPWLQPWRHHHSSSSSSSSASSSSTSSQRPQHQHPAGALSRLTPPPRRHQRHQARRLLRVALQQRVRRSSRSPSSRSSSSSPDSGRAGAAQPPPLASAPPAPAPAAAPAAWQPPNEAPPAAAQPAQPAKAAPAAAARSCRRPAAWLTASTHTARPTVLARPWCAPGAACVCACLCDGRAGVRRCTHLLSTAVRVAGVQQHQQHRTPHTHLRTRAAGQRRCVRLRAVSPGGAAGCAAREQRPVSSGRGRAPAAAQPAETSGARVCTHSCVCVCVRACARVCVCVCVHHCQRTRLPLIVCEHAKITRALGMPLLQGAPPLPVSSLSKVTHATPMTSLSAMKDRCVGVCACVRRAAFRSQLPGARGVAASTAGQASTTPCPSPEPTMRRVKHVRASAGARLRPGVRGWPSRAPPLRQLRGWWSPRWTAWQCGPCTGDRAGRAGQEAAAAVCCTSHRRAAPRHVCSVQHGQPITAAAAAAAAAHATHGDTHTHTHTHTHSCVPPQAGPPGARRHARRRARG
jgi:hypothetical protein